MQIELGHELVKASVTDYHAPNDDKEHVVLLTGATGSLGASILMALLHNPKVKKVYALVREKEGTTGLMDRIVESLRKRSYPECELLEHGLVEALPMNLESKDMGFSTKLYDKLQAEVTMIQACA